MLRHAARFVSTFLAFLFWCLACVTTAHAGWSHDAVTGTPFCTASNTQGQIAMIADGAGGVILVWEDRRSGGAFDIYAQRLDANGNPMWTSDGAAVCVASGDQRLPKLASDGAGGAIFVWYDQRSSVYPDIYAQRLSAGGTAQWTPNGVVVCNATWEQFDPVIVSDGLGGAIMGWYDYRNGSTADIFAQRVNGSGSPQWTANGVNICNAANDQLNPAIVTDGVNGAIVCWRDQRSVSNEAIYAQRINSSGAGVWTANGVALVAGDHAYGPPVAISDNLSGIIVAWPYGLASDSYIRLQRVSGGTLVWGTAGRFVDPSASSPATETGPAIASDGGFGAIVSWSDKRFLFLGDDVYAQRFDDFGSTLWSAGGIPVSQVTGDQGPAVLSPDNESGVLVAWPDARSGSLDIYAQRLDISGAARWDANGIPLSAFPNSQTGPAALWVSGSQQSVVAWEDSRSGAADLYAQRIDRYDRIGDAGALITSVADVPADQGGQVRLRWNASYFDTSPKFGVSLYGVWRQVAASSVPARAPLDAAEARPGVFRMIPDGAQSTFWEGVGTVAARGDSTYTFVAATLRDSTAAGNPLTIYFVDAHGAFAPGLWDSSPDSGYSVDNLAPAMPSPFTGTYASGSSSLSWGPNREHDLAGYRLYRGSSPGFVPGPGNRIASPTTTAYTDAAGSPYYYKLSAIDVHGNESPFALLLPDGTVDAPSAELPRVLALAPVFPVPSSGPMTLQFAVPREQRVDLAIFDAGGRLVRRVFGGLHPAGNDRIVWDGRDDSGRDAPSGVYIARLSAADAILRQRFVRLR